LFAKKNKAASSSKKENSGGAAGGNWGRECENVSGGTRRRLANASGSSLSRTTQKKPQELSPHKITPSMREIWKRNQGKRQFLAQDENSQDRKNTAKRGAAKGLKISLFKGNRRGKTGGAASEKRFQGCAPKKQGKNL